MEESGATSKKYFGQSARHIIRLSARGVTTTRALVDSLPQLPPKLRGFGFWWISAMNIQSAESVLLKLLIGSPNDRLACAATLASIGGTRAERKFVRIGQNHLASKQPDSEWLNVVVQGLRFPNCLEAEEIILRMFERKDLPGWLRGNAGDAMSCCSQLSDRRTTFFRRALHAATEGLIDSDIDVQFWSMYVIISMAHNCSSNAKRSNACFNPLLPQLREIACKDHRLAPGFWWPMSAEAEDAIFVINTGNSAEHDAADRWHGNSTRGATRHD